MPLLAIPPHVPERLRAERTRGASFGMRSIVLPEPLSFPRAPMQEALGEHARLLHARRHEILHEVTNDEAVADGLPFVFINNVAAVVAADGHDRHEVRGWCREDASWVVRRCRGLVRKLMEAPPVGRFYAVVVAGGVASLHVMTGTGEESLGPWEEDRRYSLEGLGVKVVARDVVVEPWEQLHLRRHGAMRTYWEMPDGSRGVGEVPIPRRPRTLREGVDRTLAAYEERIASELARYEGQCGPEARIVVLRSNWRHGDSIAVVPQTMSETFSRESLPTIRRILRRPVEGFDPVFVVLDHGGGLRWLSRGRRLDVAAPQPVNELSADHGD